MSQGMSLDHTMDNIPVTTNPVLDNLEKLHNQYQATEEDQSKLEELKVPLPQCELQRIKVIREARIFDTPEEETYDRYASMTSRVFKVPIALVSLMDVNRQWFKARVGLDVKETHRDVAFCAYTILESTPSVMVVHDALEDIRFKENPLVLGPPFIRFYAGASLVVESIKIGTLCIIDTVPRPNFGIKEIKMLLDIASIISQLISERRSKVLRVEYEIAQINLSVLYSLKYPLENVTTLSSPMQTLYKAMKLACHNDPNALRNEKTLNELQSTLKKFSTEMQIFHELVELCLNVASRLLDINQVNTPDSNGVVASSNKKQPNLLYCSIKELMKKVEIVVMRSNPACRLDWTMEEQAGTKLSGSVKMTPTNGSQKSGRFPSLSSPTAASSFRQLISPGTPKKNSSAATTASAEEVKCYSHPDIFVLILISMLSYLSRKGREIENISITNHDHGKLVSMTEQQVQDVLGTSAPSSPTSRSSGGKSPVANNNNNNNSSNRSPSHWYHTDLIVTLESIESNPQLPTDHFEIEHEEDQYEIVALKNILTWIGGKMNFTLLEDNRGLKYEIHLPCSLDIPMSMIQQVSASQEGGFHGFCYNFHSKPIPVHSAFAKTSSHLSSNNMEHASNATYSNTAVVDHSKPHGYFTALKDMAKNVWKSLLHGGISTTGNATIHPMSDEELLQHDRSTIREEENVLVRTLPEPTTTKQVMHLMENQDMLSLPHHFVLPSSDQTSSAHVSTHLSFRSGNGTSSRSTSINNLMNSVQIKNTSHASVDLAAVVPQQ